jgi:hypothetical protein
VTEVGFAPIVGVVVILSILGGLALVFLLRRS